MSFYLESQYLDLKTHVHKFEYEPITQIILKENKSAGGEFSSSNLTQNTFMYIQEKDILLQDVSNLCAAIEILTSTTSLNEAQKKFPFTQVKYRVCHILHKYQEQPALLDSVTEPIVSQIMITIENYVRSMIKNRSSLDVAPGVLELINIIYVMSFVRGFKSILKYFPHDVHDLEPALYFLVTQGNVNIERWEPKYIFLLWLSMIILAPFDLQTFDSKIISETFTAVINPTLTNLTLEKCILEICKFYLRSTTKLCEMSSLVIANFFKRKDIQKMNILSEYLTWCGSTFQKYQKDPLESFYTKGLLYSVFQILISVPRNELLTHIPTIYNTIFDELYLATKGKDDNTSVRHLKSKIAQRIALTYLPQNNNKWAYRKTSNSLLANMQKTVDHTKIQSNIKSKEKTDKKEAESQAEDEIFLSESETSNLEEIISYLLSSLKDKDTVVRWSAAKGIGRITSRLDQTMGNDIITSVLDLVKEATTETMWHGICLTLAETSRRGLLLPDRLEEAFNIVNKALIYEINQGTYTTGEQVRDAACFNVWAFARAYETEIILPHIKIIIKNLLLCALYDKEVNCRRAASAAFQEVVGRLGNFDNGIDILTEADFFTLGLRHNSYLNVSVFVASKADYFYIFVDHLSMVKLKHPDIDIRRLSAAALSLLVPLNPKFFIENVISKLLPLALNDALHVRHGALYGISDILLGLAGKSKLHNWTTTQKDSIFLKSLTKNEKNLIKAGECMKKFLPEYEKIQEENNISAIPAQMQADILDIVNKVEKARLYRGKGGEFMRIAISRFIEVISITKIKINATIHKRFMDTLDECLKNPIEDIQNESAKAFKEFSSCYHPIFVKEAAPYITKFLDKGTSDPIASTKRGYSRAIGCLSQELILLNIDKIIHFIQANCKINKNKELDDPETRKYTVKSIGLIIETVGVKLLSVQQFRVLLNECYQVMEDYSTDKRGDIGHIVREASMYAMVSIMKGLSLLNDKSKIQEYFTKEDTIKLLGLFLQQLLEKIDKMRLLAGSLLQEIIENYASVLHDECPAKLICETKFAKDVIAKQIKLDEEKIDKHFDINMASHNIFEAESKESVYPWNVPHCVYEYIVPMLEVSEIRYYLFKGLIVSVGGISESVYQKSFEAFRNFLNKSNDETFEDIIKISIRICKEHFRDDRLITPLFNVLGLILSYLKILLQPKFHLSLLELHECMIKETAKSKNVMKIVGTVKPIISFFMLERLKNPNGNIKEQLKELIQHLCNPLYPKVRKITADELFVLLSGEGEEYFGKKLAEKVSDFILETPWLEMPEKEVESVRNAFEQILTSESG